MPDPDRAVRLSCDPVREGGQPWVDPAEITGGQEGPVKLRVSVFICLRSPGLGGGGRWSTLGRLTGALKEGAST